MKDVFKTHIFISDPSPESLKEFVSNQKFKTGAKDICQEVLNYISDFPGIYQIIDRGINGDYLRLKRIGEISTEDVNDYPAIVVLPNKYPLSPNYTEQKKCLVNITLEGKERRAEIKKGKKIYDFYIHKQDSPSE